MALAALPAELLEAICLFLDPPALAALTQASRQLHALTANSPVLWRHLCCDRFAAWHPSHDLPAKLAAPLSAIDWRALFILRVRRAAHTRALLQRIIDSQLHRVRHISAIADYGYDAKDALLRELACPDDAPDVLARRYYATAVLERIHREMAIVVWNKLLTAPSLALDHALAAYDMFACTRPDIDFAAMSADLDRLAHGLLRRCPAFADLNTRSQAALLASYLRDEGFQGVPDTSYCALPNSFIGLVVRSDAHHSLPLISVAIFCAVARRLGLDARPCGILFHVYCLVYAPKDYSLDGHYRPAAPDAHLDYMYIDPFRSSTQVNQADLLRVLRDNSVPPSQHHAFLSETTTREMVLRTARNIMNSVQTIRQEHGALHGIHHSWIDIHPDMDNAFYATLWSMLILGPGPDHADPLLNLSTRRRQYLPYLLEQFQTHFPWDVTLLERYIVPMFQNEPEGRRLLHFVQSMHHIDALRKTPVQRSPRTASVQFTIGQLFRHKRYQYEGVITGWDTSCDAGEEWIRSMDIDGLPNGRNQAFYHVLVCDKSVRYVASENISPVSSDTPPSPAMLKLAGRHFKRWDPETHMFVSNIKDEYPDD